MFKDTMYRELREELSFYEEQDFSFRAGKRPILCEFLKREKEKDIGLRIRMRRIAMKEAARGRDKAGLMREFSLYRKQLFDYLEQNPKFFKVCKEKERLMELLHISDDTSLRKALEESRSSSLAVRRVETLDELGSLILESVPKGKRTDPYFVLQEVYLDYRLGKESALSVFEKARKLYGMNRKYHVSNETKKCLKGNIMDGDLKVIVEDLSEAILVAQAKAFLYDAGYALFCPNGSRKEDVDQEDSLGTEVHVLGKSTGRRQDHMMELVDLYWTEKGCRTLGGGFAGSQAMDYTSEKFKESCMAVYEILQGEGRSNVFLPLTVDPASGAGVYILGVENISEDSLEDGEDNWSISGKKGWHDFKCHFCTVEWTEITNEPEDGVRVSLLINACGNDIDMAIETYRNNMDNPEDRKELFSVYQGINNTLPEGIDKQFYSYFKTASAKKQLDKERFLKQRDEEIRMAARGERK